MGKKKLGKKATPTKGKAVEASHAEQTPAPLRTEKARPSVVPSTSGEQTLATGTPQIPSIPLDLVEKLLASISPGFNLTHTLARMATENTNPLLVQPPTIPTPREKLHEPSTKLTATLPEEEAKPNPKIPTSTTPDPPAESPTKTPTKTTTEPITEEPGPIKADPLAGSIGRLGGIVETEEIRADREKELKAKTGKESKFVEGIVEDVVGSEEGESESETSGSEGEKSGDSEETKVVSEERTEEVGSGDEKNIGEKPSHEEEVDQEIEGEEQDIILLEEDDIAAEKKNEEGVDQSTTRRKTRMTRRIAEILATGKNRKMGGEPSKAEEEEEEEIRLIRKPRSTRVTVTEETPIPATEEDTPTQMDEEIDATKTATEGKRYEKERKRKGKQLECPIKKKVRQAARDVVIQKPIQVPYKQAEEKSDEEMEEEAEDTASERREDPQPTHYRKIFMKVDRYLLKRMQLFKDPKQQEEFKNKVSEGKKVKSGKLVHLPSLQDLAAEEKFMAYIKNIGFVDAGKRNAGSTCSIGQGILHFL